MAVDPLLSNDHNEFKIIGESPVKRRFNKTFRPFYKLVLKDLRMIRNITETS